MRKRKVAEEEALDGEVADPADPAIDEEVE